MGKFESGVYVDLAIEPVARRANAAKVIVKSRNGKQKRLSAAEYLIEQAFIDAIKGDVKAHKVVVKWAKKHLLPVARKTVPMSKTRELTQRDVDNWHKAGVLPRGCEPILEKMSLADLNRAYRGYGAKEKGPSFPDKSIRSLRALFKAFLRDREAERTSRTSS